MLNGFIKFSQTKQQKNGFECHLEQSEVNYCEEQDNDFF